MFGARRSGRPGIAEVLDFDVLPHPNLPTEVEEGLFEHFDPVKIRLGCRLGRFSEQIAGLTNDGYQELRIVVNGVDGSCGSR
jgi:hypothetical protein